MRSRVLLSLCSSGLLLACASGGARSTPSSEAASSGSGPVQPCTEYSMPPDDGGTRVLITAKSDKVHFSSTTVKVEAGQKVYFVSQVQQDRCIVVPDGGLDLLEDARNPLPVTACQFASWTLNSGDVKGMSTPLWSCPTSDGGCSHCAQPQGIRETINGTLEVTSRNGED